MECFSHILILHAFHKYEGHSLMVKPFLDSDEHGLSAAKHPNRLSRVGVSLVGLLDRKGRVPRVEGIDILDGTPLIDMKPSVPSFD